MFGLFKKKELPTKTMVGKIHAFYRLCDSSTVRCEFVYDLFVSSEGKRSYEIEVLSNHQILYKNYAMDRRAMSMSYHEFLATQHKYWLQIVKPWLYGGDLNPKYLIDDNKTVYISRSLKHDIEELLSKVEQCDTVNAIRAKLNAATEA